MNFFLPTVQKQLTYFVLKLVSTLKLQNYLYVVKTPLGVEPSPSTPVNRATTSCLPEMSLQSLRGQIVHKLATYYLLPLPLLTSLLFWVDVTGVYIDICFNGNGFVPTF